MALDVVTDDGQLGVGELLGPHGVRGNEHWDGVHEGDARIKRTLRVKALGILGANGKVRDEDLGARVAKGAYDIHGLVRRLLDRGAVVLVESVHGRATLHGDTQRRNVGELDRVVLTAFDGLCEVAADFGGVDVEGGDELDVADVIIPEHHVHETGHVVGGIGVAVVGNALDE